MTDRHAMEYLTYDECRALGHTPYAVYGGKVYSYRTRSERLVPHGTPGYALALAESTLQRAAAAAGTRGA
jgi:hypothetical protein